MTEELQGMLNDPKIAVQVALGDPAPTLVAQRPGEALELDKVYFTETKRFILKKAHLARDDVRIFDTEGHLVANSHHPGKNPYDALDPLGLSNADARYNVAGGEWESICDVTGHGRGLHSIKIRPKTMTMHGRQWIKRGDNVFMNVGKVGKLSSMSIRDTFEVCKEDDDDEVYRVQADLMGRTFEFRNGEGELVAIMAKTKKALIQTAVFGSGSESTIDVAPGVDCSVILAAIFGVMQVGSSVIGDFASNYLFDPLKEQLVDQAVDATGTQDVVNMYSQASQSATHQAGWLEGVGRFLKGAFR